MAKQGIQLAAVGFDDHERVILRSLVTVFQKSLDRHWVCTDASETADVLVVDVDRAVGRAVWDRLSPGAQITVAYTDDPKKLEARYYLDKPLRGRGLLNLLTAIDTGLTRGDAAREPARQAPAVPVAPTATSSGTEMALDIIAALGHDQAVLFELPDGTRFIVDRAKSLCIPLSELQDLAVLQDLTPSQITSRPIDNEELSGLIDGYPALPLDRFLWSCALSCSRDRLLAALNASKGFNLSHWPDFGAVPHTYEHIRIASFLSNKGGSIDDIVSEVGAERHHVASCLNAAALSGTLTSGAPAKGARGGSSTGATVLSVFRRILPFRGPRRGVKEADALKIVFAGTVGAGKTTAINTVSEIATISNEGKATDETAMKKGTTTVGMDYGEVSIDDQLIRLYGAPGQRRFSFIWHHLAKGADGFVVLTDNSRRLPLSDLSIYLDHFAPHLKNAPTVIGVSRLDHPGGPTLADYRRFLSDKGESYPIVSVDVRTTQGVMTLINILRATREFSKRSAA